MGGISLMSDPLLQFVKLSATAASEGGGPQPSSVVPGPAMPAGPVQPPMPIPSVNPLNAATASNPGAPTSISGGSPGAAKSFKPVAGSVPKPAAPMTATAKKADVEVPEHLRSHIKQPGLLDKANDFGNKHRGLLALGGLGLAGLGAYTASQGSKDNDEQRLLAERQRVSSMFPLVSGSSNQHPAQSSSQHPAQGSSQHSGQHSNLPLEQSGPSHTMLPLQPSGMPSEIGRAHV